MDNVDHLVNTTIPIYTLRNPHPVKKRHDCPLERDYKNLKRQLMRKELSREGITKDEETEIIERYKKQISQL